MNAGDRLVKTVPVFIGVAEFYDSILKLSVDGRFNLSIIRPTSGAGGTEKAL